MATKRQAHKAIYYLSIAALLLALVGSIASASPLVPRQEPTDKTINLTIAGHTVSVHGIVLSVILFLTGAYLCFLGGVHQNTTMFLVGFYVGSNVAYIVLTNAKADYGENTATILLVVSVVVGLLAGLLLSCCFFLAVYLLGALLGYMAALWLLAWANNGLIETNWGRAILIVCFVIAGVILMAFLERPMIVIATAFIGAFAIFIGVDLYVKTGFVEAVETFLRVKNLGVFEATTQVRGMLGGTLGLALVGALLQWLLIRRSERDISWSSNYPNNQYGWRRV
ncbi:hypothetical protein CLU79DRAFT_740217 [Phycomyces nitens]|nr:hypothetical protein CLU79DRAFT_740217 [Phycomyces nitens]